jgi:hypothetical protein
MPRLPPIDDDEALAPQPAADCRRSNFEVRHATLALEWP